MRASRNRICAIPRKGAEDEYRRDSGALIGAALFGLFLVPVVYVAFVRAVRLVHRLIFAGTGAIPVPKLIRHEGRQMILYGIPTCDTCKKALKALEAAGHAVQFRDIRKDPLSEAELARLVTEFGDRLINKTSTTYRGFNDFLKASEAEAQIAAQPAVMKRPVIEAGERLFLGWDDAVQAALLK